MIVGIGSDLCNIERIQSSLDRFGMRFEKRVFTDVELRKAARRPMNYAATLAKRFAAKEAFLKAVGTGFKSGVFMRDIGVVNTPSGAPTLALTGEAKSRLDALVPAGHVAKVHLTLTDDHPWAQALVVIEALPRGMKDHRMAEELALTGEDRETQAAPSHGTDWWGEAKGIFWLVLAVLGFHSLLAKPFYIPSESMMPTLLVGDRLVVTKYPYGYSYVTPTFHVLPFMSGRLFGSVPKRGDIVIVTPTDARTDYIKRVIGLPGEWIEMHGGIVYINSRPVKRERLGLRALKVDANLQCDPRHYPGALGRDAASAAVCNVQIVRETLPGGASYDTIDTRLTVADNFAPVRIPAGRVFLMGDNRDNSADSRFSLADEGLGGPVPIENMGGRAEFITFSLDGSAGWNPLSWAGSFRAGRAGNSLHPDREGQ